MKRRLWWSIGYPNLSQQRAFQNSNLHVIHCKSSAIAIAIKALLPVNNGLHGAFQKFKICVPCTAEVLKCRFMLNAVCRAIQNGIQM